MGPFREVRGSSEKQPELELFPRGISRFAARQIGHKHYKTGHGGRLAQERVGLPDTGRSAANVIKGSRKNCGLEVETMIVIECTGDGRSRGRMHGEVARGLIRDGLQRWADATAGAAGIPITRYVSAFLSDTALLAAIETRLPDLVEEMRGIADGAGVPFDQVAAYNLMDEQWWYDLERTPNAEPGCSVVAFADQGTGAVLLGQNMDLPAYMDGGQVVLRIQAPGQPEELVLSAAGLLGLTGVNQAGLGLCVNTLLMLRHSRSGLPVTAVIRGALRHERRDAALAFLQSVSHASGQHYAVGDPGGVMGLECSATGKTLSPPASESALIHTNHPLANHEIDPVAEAALEQRGSIADSKRRLEFLNEQSASIRQIADIRRVLADRSVPICKTPTRERNSTTFGSVIFELTPSPRAHFCPGLPTSEQWEQLGWSSAAQEGPAG
jgi:isopenicillin-N N-acyltransferase-like protein